MEVREQKDGIESNQSFAATPGHSDSFATLSGAGKNSDGNKKTIGIVVAVIVVLGVAFGAFKMWSGANDKKAVGSDSARAVLTVDLVPVKRQNFERKLLVSGTVSAWDPVQVGSEVSGLRVEKIAVDEGLHVKKGQVMALLSNSILKAQLEQQQARLTSSEASLTKAIQPNRPEDVTSIKAAFSQAEVTVAQEEANLMRSQATAAEAEANAKRYEFLVKQGVVSGMEGLNRTTVAKTALADLHSAEARVKAAKYAAQQAHEKMTMAVSGGRNEDVIISRASLAEMKATVNQLQSQLDQTVIKAPCDGLVVKRSAHIGEIASATKVMFELVRDGRLELKAQVSESDLSRIRPGDKVEIQSALSDTSTCTGTVREISPTIELDSRLGTVRVDLPDNQNFRSGNYARGEIFLGNQSVMAVPSSSVVYKDNRAIVFTVSSDDIAQMHFIETGDRTSDTIEVRSGLHDNDRVVGKGAGFLKDGDKVRVGSGR